MAYQLRPENEDSHDIEGAYILSPLMAVHD
jgi:hypothetical protein